MHILMKTYGFYDNIDYAYFDEDLWILLQENDAREKIKEVLIKIITND